MIEKNIIHYIEHDEVQKLIKKSELKTAKDYSWSDWDCNILGHIILKTREFFDGYNDIIIRSDNGYYQKIYSVCNSYIITKNDVKHDAFDLRHITRFQIVNIDTFTGKREVLRVWFGYNSKTAYELTFILDGKTISVSEALSL